MADVFDRMARKKPTFAVAECIADERSPRRRRRARSTRTSGSTCRCGARRPAWSATRWPTFDPHARRRLPAQRPTPTRRELAKLHDVRQDAARDDPEGAAGAGHRPRRLPLLRPGLRRRGAGHPGHQHRERGRRPGDQRAGRFPRRAQDQGGVRRDERRRTSNIKALLEGCEAAGPHGRRSAASCSPTRWARTARRRAPTSAWSGTTWTRSSKALQVNVADRERRLPTPPPILDVHDVTVAYHRKPVLWDVDLDARRAAAWSASSAPTARARARSSRRSSAWCRWPAARCSVFGQPVDRSPPPDRLRAAARERRLGLSGQRARRRADGHLRPARLVPPARPRRARAGRGSAWTRSGWPTSAAGRSASSPAASSSGRSWPGPWPSGPTSTSWTSRWPASMRPPSGSSSSCSNELRDEGKTVIVVHHDLRTVPEYFDHVVLLNMRLVASGPTATVVHAGEPAQDLRRPAGDPGRGRRGRREPGAAGRDRPTTR